MSKREEMTQLDRIEAKLNYLMIKNFGWEEFQTTDGELDQWQVKKVRAKIRTGGKQREFIWEVTCPATPAEPSWDNDFRPERCGCRRFPTEGKARRYVERMSA